PWKRTTMSACSESQSTIFPLPSSPHWEPTTATFAIQTSPSTNPPPCGEGRRALARRGGGPSECGVTPTPLTLAMLAFATLSKGGRVTAKPPETQRLVPRHAAPPNRLLSLLKLCFDRGAARARHERAGIASKSQRLDALDVGNPLDPFDYL